MQQITLKNRLESDEIKERLFRILSDFADYCDENQLRYYLCYGTLLGAVRHKGFIPWDDDIDVMMPRPDFDRLVEMNIKGMNPNYRLEGYSLNNSLWPFLKIQDISTRVENEYRKGDKHLWIDIFPLDGLPADKKKSDKILKKTHKLRQLYKYYGAKIGKGKNIFRIVSKVPIIIIGKCGGLKILSLYIDRLAHRYKFDESDYIGEIVWSLGDFERMKKADYLPAKEVEFCGRQFHAPACWDIYLTSIYGDYMMPPAEKDRTTHEYTAYITGEDNESK